MSRRASLLAKQEKRKPKVRFPDELVFLDNIKGNDIKACHSMLRRASVQLDINGLDNSGLTPLHNAVLEGNLSAVKLLLQHGADINRKDADTWSPLHAACANGEADIARYLLSKGADRDIKTSDGERPLDLCDARDFAVISVMLESDTARKARLLNATDDDGLDFDDDDAKRCNRRNDNNGNSDDDKRSSNPGSCSDSGDSSPEVPRRNLRNDIRKATSTNTSKSSTSSLVKGIGNLKTLYEKTSSPPTLTVGSAKQRNTPSPTPPSEPTKQVDSDAASAKPPKPAGRSILKKSPQQCKTAAQ